MQYSVSGTFSEEKVQKILKNMMKDESEKQLGVYSVFKQDTNAWMGIVGVAWMEENKVGLVYRFFKKFWGQGYATEALKALLEYIATNFVGLEVWAYIEKENVSSRKVAEKLNLKFQKNSTFHGLPVMCYQWLISRS